MANNNPSINMEINSIKVPHLDISQFDALEFTEKLQEKVEEPENPSFLKLLQELNLSGCNDKKYEEVALILYGMGLAKYVKTFLNEKIDLDTFLRLKEKDFMELGILEEDREILINNLKFHQKGTDEFKVFENHSEDLKIAKNVYNLLILQQHYCSYVDLQMKKHKLKDYSIGTKKDSAVNYLKAFTESALKQAEIISEMLFEPKSSSHLIEKTLMANNLELPQHLKDKLVTKKKQKNIFKGLAIGTTLLGISFFVGKQVIKKVE